jgi:transposase InsO family protein
MKMHSKDFPVEIMASVLGVSKAGYYRFLQETKSQRTLENEALLKKIKDIHENSYETYGSPRIHAELKDLGETCSRQRVARLMKASSIAAKMHKRFKKTTHQSGNPYFVPEDLIRQDFTASGPNEAWVADITYVLTQIGWVYCAVVLDLFSRMVVGLSLSDRITTDLVLRALQQGLTQRRPSAGIIHHSDRGSQYTAKALKILADDYGVQLSMGRVANAFDNAVAESFFHTLKTEWVHFYHYQNLQEATMSIFQYVFGFYNQKRKHSTLGYLSPAQFENNFCKN